jgi:surfactin synthase thioesterase subunit
MSQKYASASGHAFEHWLRRFHPSQHDRFRLVCFPHAGGSASYYYAMSQSLAKELEVLVVQYPGRQDRRMEGHVASIPQLAADITEALSDRDDRPLAFFGHSMGASVAFEVSRRMKAAGSDRLAQLFISGRRAPSADEPGGVHLASDRELIAELQRVGVTDQRVLDDDDLRRMILATTRADYRALETYSCPPDSVVDCPITVFLGDCDPYLTVKQAAAWRAHCAGKFNIEVFPGAHFYFNTCLPAVSEAIVRALDEIE